MRRCAPTACHRRVVPAALGRSTKSVSAGAEREPRPVRVVGGAAAMEAAAIAIVAPPARSPEPNMFLVAEGAARGLPGGLWMQWS